MYSHSAMLLKVLPTLESELSELAAWHVWAKSSLVYLGVTGFPV